MESNSGIWVPSGKYIEMQEELKDLRARLAQRHFFGKVYDVTAESINQLAGELDAANEEISDLYGIRAAINDENHQLKEDLMEANKIIEHLNAQITIDTARIRDLVETVQEERDNQKAMDTTRIQDLTETVEKGLMKLARDLYPPQPLDVPDPGAALACGEWESAEEMLKRGERPCGSASFAGCSVTGCPLYLQEEGK